MKSKSDSLSYKQKKAYAKKFINLSTALPSLKHSFTVRHKLWRHSLRLISPNSCKPTPSESKAKQGYNRLLYQILESVSPWSLSILWKKDNKKIAALPRNSLLTLHWKKAKFCDGEQTQKCVCARIKGLVMVYSKIFQKV